MRKTWSLIILLSIFLSISIFGKEYVEGKLYRHQLENGLTVLTMERHIAPLIYHQLTYKVGSRNEAKGETGISHVVEHMMFKGTEKYGKGSVSKTISDNSGIFNAFTMRDMTAYYEYMPKNKIDIALDIESDRMQNSIFNPEEFKSEIEVIKQERRLRVESNVNGVYREELYSLAFKSHPTKNPVIGWMSDLDHITREDAFKYYKTFYTPNNAFLVLVGDFDTEKMLEKVKSYYGSIPRGPEIEEMYSVEAPAIVKKTFSLKHPDIASPTTGIYFHIPAYNNPDMPKLKVAGKILCAKSRTARLYKRLVNDEQIAISAAGGFSVTKDPDLFSINIGIKADSLKDRVEEIVFEEIEKMKTEPVEDYELQKIKNLYKFSEKTNDTKNVDIGRKISTYEAYYGWDSYQDFFNGVIDVTKEDIMEVMNKYFDSDKVIIGYKIPGRKVNAKAAKVEEIEEVDEEGTKFFYKNDILADEVDALEGSEEFPEILTPEKIEPKIKLHTLSNGLKLYVIENHLTPSIQVAGVIEAGLMEEEKKGNQTGISSVLGSVMNRGTEAEDYMTISKRMNFVPFSFSIKGSSTNFVFSGYSLIDDMDEMLQTGMDILTKPGFRDKDISFVKKRMKLGIKKRFTRTSMKAFYYLYDKIYEGHPLSEDMSSIESVNSITKEDIIELHKKYIRPENTSLLMIGDLSEGEMVELAEKYFGKWENNSEAPVINEYPKVAPLNGKEIKVFQDKSYKQAIINIGFNPRNDLTEEEEYEVRIMNYILSASALTSRVGIELRDKQGLIYGIKSELHSQADKIGYWKFNTKTAPKNAEKVITGLFEQIKLLIDKGITDEELKTAKKHYLGLLPFYIETPDDIGTICFEAISQNKPLNSFDKKAEKILKVTKEDVIKVAKKYFDMDNFIIVVDGPLEENALDHVLDKL